tara:strand:+ start:41 stop:256 length:216 start_codon:yes stop_codon:yes gene_type:complete
MVNRASIRQQIMKPGLKKKKPKLGTGKRFKQLTSKLKGAKDPKALAAYIGRKKYGKKKMSAMAAKGRKRRS